jgi:transposase
MIEDEEVYMKPATSIILPYKMKKELTQIANSSTAEARLALRAKIILKAAEGLMNMEIAMDLGISENSASKWRVRFARNPCLESLKDLEGRGRKETIPVVLKYEVMKTACSPVKQEYKIRGENRWTLNLIQEEIKKESGTTISLSEIWSILNKAHIKPHKFKMWQHSPDPEFKKKIQKIVDLYFDKNASVWCVDEKTGIQAIERKKWQKRRQTRMETDYQRHGTLNLFAAFHIRTGEVFAKPTMERKQKDVDEFMKALAKKNGKKKSYIIWDNLNTHGADKFKQLNQFEFVYTPKHASWINQVEIWFSILHRKAIKHVSFKNIFDLGAKMMLFVRNWNEQAHPFKWKFAGFFDKKINQAI